MTAPLAGPARLPYVIAIVWLVFTVSLAAWWLFVGLMLADELREANLSSTNFRRMFLWEGAAFIAVLVAGGIAMVLAIRREQARRRVLETFFMSFTHDLKTALASVQLQAEGLREDWPEPSARGPIDRLLHDTVRLQIQLENSLFVAQPDGRLLGERLHVAAAVERHAEDWPGLTVAVAGDADVVADARAFDAVVRNLLQNAVVHGGATRVDVDIARRGGRVRIRMADNGRGVPEEARGRLGELFVRPAVTSGTGVGLFVCRRLIARMQGRLVIQPSGPGQGLVVDVELPEAG